MSKRRIVIYSNQDDRDEVIESSAKTWGELLSENPHLSAFIAGKSATIRDPRTLISGSSTTLPDHDLTIFLTVEKIKAGASASALSTFQRELAGYLANFTTSKTCFKGSLTLSEINGTRNKKD